MCDIAKTLAAAGVREWLEKLRDEGRQPFAFTEAARDAAKAGLTESDPPAIWEWITPEGRAALAKARGT